MSQYKHVFHSKHSAAHRRRVTVSSTGTGNAIGNANLNAMWAGIVSAIVDDSSAIEIAISIHDSVYTTDYASACIPYNSEEPQTSAANIAKHVTKTLRDFSKEHLCKFLGAGISLALLKECPDICTRLWLDMDVVPIVFNIKPYHTDSNRSAKHHIYPNIAASGAASGISTPDIQNLQVPIADVTDPTQITIIRTLDEQADSAARKCIMFFGPNNSPRIFIGPKNLVEVDAGGRIHLLDGLDEYKKSVKAGTWNAVVKLADELKYKKVKFGFFSSTPQGGGVALMRHALIRFFNALDLDVSWYVPNPSPSVFRTTKNNHNILQGVASASTRLTQNAKAEFDEWIQKNGSRWTANGGPLAPGGVDIAFIDDPQMPGLIPLIKRIRPEIPIVYRSHIEIRSELVRVKGSPQEEVWKYLWNNIQHADLFISHPVSKFVPSDVLPEKMALLGAATDWLDGLNKKLDPWDSQYYMGEFRSLCAKVKMHELKWPSREYIVQIARFDPSKGIPDVIDSYVKLRKLLEADGEEREEKSIPQLLIAANMSVDDPDATIIYDQAIDLIEAEYKAYAEDMVLMRLPPGDQLLNALMANSKIALQLSTREGFEVKVSEALHAGKPIVASRTGGIPLQIEDGRSGYLTDVGDNVAVARHLYNLHTNETLYKKMSAYARSHISDEVSTVGNAAAWMYLAVIYSRGEKVRPNGQWLNDMLRVETGQPYADDEPKLPRGGLDMQG